MEKELGLSILGAVPQIRRRGKLAQSPEEAGQRGRGVPHHPPERDPHAGLGAGPVTLTISSASPGDGKSLVSANLALSFAESGYKVVLVDGDIRRGELHRSFGVDRKPGLLDCPARHRQLEQILRSGGHPNLTMIPCGTRFERGPEMLGSDAMVKLMATLQRRFNCVIVDSPPLGAGVDPFVLSTLTRNVVLVVRSGETDREFAVAKLKLFDRLPVEVLGAVLNDVRTEGAYRHYAYVYGYTADELDPARRRSGPGPRRLRADARPGATTKEGASRRPLSRSGSSGRSVLRAVAVAAARLDRRARQQILLVEARLRRVLDGGEARPEPHAQRLEVGRRGCP